MLRGKSEETIMAAAFAQIKNRDERRSRNRREHIRADGKSRGAAEKGNARRRAAVRAVAEHGDDFTAPQRGHQWNCIGRRTGQRQETEFALETCGAANRISAASLSKPVTLMIVSRRASNWPAASQLPRCAVSSKTPRPSASAV